MTNWSFFLSWTKESNEQSQLRGLPKLRPAKDRNVETFTEGGAGSSANFS